MRGKRRRTSHCTPWSSATAISTAVLVSVIATSEWMAAMTSASTTSTPNDTVNTVFRVTCEGAISRFGAGASGVTGLRLRYPSEAVPMVGPSPGFRNGNSRAAAARGWGAGNASVLASGP